MPQRAAKNSQVWESPLFWPAYLKGQTLFVLDETQLPRRKVYIQVKTTAQAVNVIRQMKTRAFGQFLVVLYAFLLLLKRDRTGPDAAVQREIEKTARALNESRPTFPFSEVTSIVVAWGQSALAQGIDIVPFLEKNILGYLAGIRGRRLGRVAEIAKLIKNGDYILTHCNVSGELAMAARLCGQQGKKIHFFATETRPYFQGAKLTVWELKESGVPVTLVADNAVGSLMADGLVNKVIVGSDRSCANGDIANKIGTYQIAVLAREFGIPLYVLTQPSNKIPAGKDIPVEIRSAQELLVFQGKKIVPGAVKGFYPGFDIVPHSFIKRSVAINVR